MHSILPWSKIVAVFSPSKIESVKCTEFSETVYLLIYTVKIKTNCSLNISVICSIQTKFLLLNSMALHVKEFQLNHSVYIY